MEITSSRKLFRTRFWLWLLLIFVVVLFSVQWMTRMPGRSYANLPPALTEEETALRARLENHVRTLAEDIGERHLRRYDALTVAADYVEKTLQAAGYTVTAQEYVVENKTIKNLEARVTGHTLPDEIVVIGAHYDSVAGSPGANDNATGAAALLEIARLFTSKHPARSVHFVAFVNEEAPFFFTPDMGSRRYASRTRAQSENIIAMLSLETIGYYVDAKDSQRYPFVFRFFYPDVGNFIGFVGNLASRALVRQCIASFRSHTPFPSEGITAPWWIPGISWSDHSSFWHEGYPAIMVTDTAPFRYPYYHTKTDTPKQIDFARLARVVAGLARVTLDVAGENR
jgi:Zn-dependent M28 family amino/carboxypeptidase